MPPTSPWAQESRRQRDIQQASPEANALYAAEAARRAFDTLPNRIKQRPILQETLKFIADVLNPVNQNQDTLHHLSTSIRVFDRMDTLLNLMNMLANRRGPTKVSSAVHTILMAFGTIYMYCRHLESIDHPPEDNESLYRNTVQTAYHSAQVAGDEESDWHREHTLHQHIAGPLDQHFDPSWRTSDVVSLARQIVQTRDLHLLPILADALQDAGCDSEEILNQLRHQSQLSTPAHWVIRQILG